MERAKWADPERVDELVQSLRDRLERQPLRQPQAEQKAHVSVQVGDHHQGPVYVGRDPFVPQIPLAASSDGPMVPLTDYLALQQRHEAALLALRWRRGWWVAGILLMVVLVMALK